MWYIIEENEFYMNNLRQNPVANTVLLALVHHDVDIRPIILFAVLAPVILFAVLAPVDFRGVTRAWCISRGTHAWYISRNIRACYISWGNSHLLFSVLPNGFKFYSIKLWISNLEWIKFKSQELFDIALIEYMA